MDRGYHNDSDGNWGFGSNYPAHQQTMASGPYDTSSKLKNEVERLNQRLSESHSDCRSLQNALDTVHRKSQAEIQRIQDNFESALKSAERTAEQLRIQLFTALKAATRFLEAEKIYHEILDPLPASGRGAKSDLMYEFADMMIQQKRYEEAEETARDAFNHRKALVEKGGQWSDDLKLSHRQLSSSLVHQNSLAKQQQAIVMHRQVWENDPLHDWRVENGDRLCEIYANQKRYYDAQCIQHEVWEERSISGIRDEATMRSALQRIDMLEGNISMLNQPVDENSEEKIFWQKKIRDFITEIWNGIEVPETDAKILAIGKRLGEAHYQRRDFDRAGDIFEQVWEGNKKSLGDEHRETLACGHRLGEIHYIQKNYTKAGDIFEHVWQGYKKSLGDTDPITLECGHRLGDIHYNGKAYDRAEIVLSELWNGGKSSLGDWKSKVLASGHRLGEIHNKRKEYVKAELVLGQVWNGRKDSLGETDSETLESGHQLAQSIHAQVDDDQEKLSKAKDIMKGVWDARKLALEGLSANTVSSSSYLTALESGCLYGSLLVKSDNYAEAEEVLRPLWDLKSKPEAEASQLQVGHFLGVCLARQGHCSKAKEVLQSVLSRQSSTSAGTRLETSKEYEDVCTLEEKEKRRMLRRNAGRKTISRK